MTSEISLRIPGVVNGKSIELEHETGLPTGSQVLVNIATVPLTLSEKLSLADALCGSWANDTGLTQIFAEIGRNRSL